MKICNPGHNELILAVGRREATRWSGMLLSIATSSIIRGGPVPYTQPLASMRPCPERSLRETSSGHTDRGEVNP
jgi:hypothetical protein